MRAATIRRWSFVHTWTSLICTLFLLLLAVTGLPLIFHHELEHLLGDAPELREMAPGTPHLDLQQLVTAAERPVTTSVVYSQAAPASYTQAAPVTYTQK